MNKKLLSIFIMIMSLSLLFVSCGEKPTDPGDNNTGNNGGDNGGGTPPPAPEEKTTIGINEFYLAFSKIDYTAEDTGDRFYYANINIPEGEPQDPDSDFAPFPKEKYFEYRANTGYNNGTNPKNLSRKTHEENIKNMIISSFNGANMDIEITKVEVKAPNRVSPYPPKDGSALMFTVTATPKTGYVFDENAQFTEDDLPNGTPEGKLTDVAQSFVISFFPTGTDLSGDNSTGTGINRDWVD